MSDLKIWLWNDKPGNQDNRYCFSLVGNFSRGIFLRIENIHLDTDMTFFISNHTILSAIEEKITSHKKEESIITNIIAWVRTIHIRVILSTW